MSCDTHEHILSTIAAIQALRRMRTEIDPASGLSIQLRCGVARDNPSCEDDAESRPWVLVQLSGSANGSMDALRSIIDTAIAEQLKSLDLWMRFAANDIKALQHAIAAAETAAQAYRALTPPKAP